MTNSSSFRFRQDGFLAASLIFGLAMALSIPFQARAQAAPESSPVANGQGRILLVLPFDNRTGQPSLEWIREAAAEILSRRLRSAGFAPLSRTDRLYALDHLGLPQGFHPSRATSLKLAETLDADSIVVGSYVTDGSGILVEARLVDVPHLSMSPPVTARGEMREMVSVFDSLAWELTRQLDPGFKVSEETFVAVGSNLHLAAFEQYIRGITEPDQQERLRHLNQSVMLNPEFSPAWMALGREEYAGQQYDQAAAAFAKVAGNDTDNALEAGFYRGLCLLFSGDYPRAGEAFAGVAQVLPLAEVLNNQGVALARQGKDGIPLFREALATDPNQADYHFNLAVSLKRHGNTAEAVEEMAQSLKLRPSDNEAVALLKAWSGKATAPAPLPETDQAQPADAKPDPLERIERNFDGAAFHQAALAMDQMNAARLEAMAPAERAQKLSAQAHDYLERGLLLEAERLYQSAVAAAPKTAAAHSGLAEVRERTGDTEDARKEAVISLQLLPSVEAYLVLGRLDMAAGRIDQVVYEAGEALRIDPKNKAALDLKEQIEAKEGQKK